MISKNRTRGTSRGSAQRSDVGGLPDHPVQAVYAGAVIPSNCRRCRLLLATRVVATAMTDATTKGYGLPGECPRV